MRSRHSLPIFALAAAVLGLLTGCAEETAPSVRPIERDPNLLVVYCACGLLPSVEAAREQFLSAYAGKSVEVTSGEPLELAKRVRSGEVPDILVFPGEAEIGELEREEHLDRASRQIMGGLSVVIAVPRGNPAQIGGPEDLMNARVTSIAVPLPGMTSPGTAAERELERTGLWQSLQAKMIVKQTPLEVLEAVSRGDVDAAVIYDPCLRLNMAEGLEVESGEPRDAQEPPAEPGEVREPPEPPAGSVEVVSSLTGGESRLTGICVAVHRRSPNALLAQRFMRALRAEIEREPEAESPESATENAPEAPR